MPGPTLPEFIVNTWSGTWQDNPDITTLENGNVVVVWDSKFLESGLDVQYVAAQIFRPDGARAGGEKILSDLSLVANYARVAALEGGGFAVVWEGSLDSVLNPADIYTATFDHLGNRVSAIRKVSPPADDYYFAPEVVSRSDGGYTVIWSGDEATTGNPDGTGSFARSFSASGIPTTGIVHLNEPEIGDQHNVHAARLSNGNLVTIWESEFRGESPSGLPSDLRARILGPDGQPVTAEFRLAPDTVGPNSGFALTDTPISVAALAGGRFVATWAETVLEGQANGDTAHRLYGQVFSAAGRPEAPKFKINTFDDDIPDHSSVVGLNGGGFVVVWDQASRSSDVYRDVFGQYFSESGRKLGPNFVVNQSIPDAQEWPSVTALTNGGFFVAYESDYLDGDYDAIAGRTFSGLPPEVLIGSAFDDRLKGPDRDDLIEGVGGDDRLSGGGGNDTLDGGVGNDGLKGGDGNDLLIGGAGKDKLRGNGGPDAFYFADLGKADRDRIEDFKPGKDKVWLDANVFEAVADKLKKTAFETGKKADDGNDHVIHDRKKGKLLYDPDGKGGQDQVLFATVEKGLKLEHKDFEIVEDFLV